MRLRFTLLVLAWACGAGAAARAAAPEEPLALKDALDRAIAGNVDLQRERVAIDLSAANLEAAHGLFDVTLFAESTFSRRTTPPLTSQDIGSGFTNRLDNQIGVRRMLESGGTLSLSGSGSWSLTNSRFSCGFDAGTTGTCNFFGGNLGLTFTHPLLRGFGSEVTQANLRRRRIEHDAALLDRQMRVANLLRDVVIGYWEVAYATQDLAIRRSAVELAREQLRITRAQIDVGRLAPVDAAAVERAIGDREQEVAAAEQRLYFRTLDLRRLFGARPDVSLAVFVAAEAPSVTVMPEVDAAAEVERAVAANPQLRALRLGLDLSQIDVETALSTLRPRLDFVGTAGSTARTRELSDTIDGLLRMRDLTWSAGLSFELPLQNRAARGGVEAARLRAEDVRLSSHDFDLSLRDQTLRLASDVKTATIRLDLARKTVGFAQQSLEAEKARFAVGRATNNEVLLRQQELKTAEIQVLRATVDVLVSETALSAITARILERYGVTLKGS